MLEVRRVTSRQDMRRFVEFPVRLYGDNPYFIPSMYTEEIETMQEKTNPAFEFCEARYYLAIRNGEVVGRIAGILHKRANEKWGTRLLRFTRFDFIDDLEVSGALLRAVEAYAREKGMMQVHGPIGYSDFDKEGMLIEGFEERSMFITFYNAAYYVRHMQHYGYQKSVDWIEYLITVPTAPEETAAKACAYLMKRMRLTRVTVRKAKDVMPYVDEIFALLDEAYSPLYGTVPVTNALRDMYIRQFFSFVRAEYVEIILDEHGKIAAFGLAFPSVATAMQRNRGHLHPWNALMLLRAIYGKHDVIELMLIAVRPDLQGKGLNSLLLHNVTCTAIKNGVRFAETGPSLESNFRMWATWKRYEARQHKKRRCWIKTLETEPVAP